MQGFIKERKVLLIVIGCVILIIGGIWFYFDKSNDNILLIDDTSIDIVNSDENIEASELEDTNIIVEQPREIMVHIVGQVKNPGVILLIEGARLIDAIEKLGGATEEADLEVVNLAQKLRDEERVYIPKIGEINLQDSIATNTNNSNQEQNLDQININTASQDQLKTLSGIGDVISRYIIEYREAQGGFKSIEEIKEVSRIGDKVFNEIKDKIKI